MAHPSSRESHCHHVSLKRSGSLENLLACTLVTCKTLAVLSSSLQCHGKALDDKGEGNIECWMLISLAPLIPLEQHFGHPQGVPPQAGQP